MNRHTIALLAWSLSWTTGSAGGLTNAIYSTEAACNAAGQKIAVETKAQEAEDKAAAIKDHGYFVTTIGYDVVWQCTEAKTAKPKATK
jgi:hypothetical protein